ERGRSLDVPANSESASGHSSGGKLTPVELLGRSCDAVSTSEHSPRARDGFSSAYSSYWRPPASRNDGKNISLSSRTSLSNQKSLRRWITIGDFECGRLDEENIESLEDHKENSSETGAENRSVDSENGKSECMRSDDIQSASQSPVEEPKTVNCVPGEAKKKSKIEIILKNNLKGHTPEVSHEIISDDCQKRFENNVKNGGDSENFAEKLKEDSSSTSNCEEEDCNITERNVVNDTKANQNVAGKWQTLEKLGKPLRKPDDSQENNDVSDLESEKSNEDMDAELPTSENITSLYDLVRAVKNSNENLPPQEIESKFKQISLAFKTDRITLKQRLEVQQRQRDIAEVNFERELAQLRSSILVCTVYLSICIQWSHSL
ncbi:hypothetical protein SK128_010193, partial [Halocaridina rubra]